MIALLPTHATFLHQFTMTLIVQAWICTLGPIKQIQSPGPQSLKSFTTRAMPSWSPHLISSTYKPANPLILNPAGHILHHDAISNTRSTLPANPIYFHHLVTRASAITRSIPHPSKLLPPLSFHLVNRKFIIFTQNTQSLQISTFIHFICINS